MQQPKQQEKTGKKIRAAPKRILRTIHVTIFRKHRFSILIHDFVPDVVLPHHLRCHRRGGSCCLNTIIAVTAAVTAACQHAAVYAAATATTTAAAVLTATAIAVAAIAIIVIKEHWNVLSEDGGVHVVGGAPNVHRWYPLVPLEE